MEAVPEPQTFLLALRQPMPKFRQTYNTDMQRVHIVGLSPRTGTTLIQELMAHCFEFEGVPTHEMSIFKVPHGNPKTFCTKSPRELKYVFEIGPMPGLWCICMVRDPRDVIVSKHQLKPDVYYTSFKLLKENYDVYNKYVDSYPNFIFIKYENLVKNPDQVQELIQEAIPFLKKKANFSEFHKIANPSKRAVNALGGVRKINTSSIGNWRNHLPRIKAQLQLFETMPAILRDLGYENDDKWIEMLDGVVADNGRPERRPHSLYVELREIVRRKYRVLLARMRIDRAVRGSKMG